MQRDAWGYDCYPRLVLRTAAIIVFVTSCCLLPLLTACCAGGIDDMTIHVSVGPDVLDRECRSLSFEWNDTTMVSADDAVVISSNGAGRGAPEDWIQIFDARGSRVFISYFRERDHECEGGCPGNKHFYPFPDPGTYTLVHFRDGGRTTDDESLGDYMGAEALVTTLIVE